MVVVAWVEGLGRDAGLSCGKREATLRIFSSVNERMCSPREGGLVGQCKCLMMEIRWC